MKSTKGFIFWSLITAFNVFFATYWLMTFITEGESPWLLALTVAGTIASILNTFPYLNTTEPVV